jgi:hypothetical protein
MKIMQKMRALTLPCKLNSRGFVLHLYLNSSVDSKSTDMITVPLALAVADQSSD